MTSLEMNGHCTECGQDYLYCEDCGGIIEACSKGCCYGPDGQTYLADCVCDISISPDAQSQTA